MEIFANVVLTHKFHKKLDLVHKTRCTVYYAAAMELDRTVSESLPFGSGKELFDNGLKYLN